MHIWQLRRIYQTVCLHSNTGAFQPVLYDQPMIDHKKQRSSRCDAQHRPGGDNERLKEPLPAQHTGTDCKSGAAGQALCLCCLGPKPLTPSKALHQAPPFIQLILRGPRTCCWALEGPGSAPSLCSRQRGCRKGDQSVTSFSIGWCTHTLVWRTSMQYGANAYGPARSW
jgi:hypothetical protein